MLLAQAVHAAYILRWLLGEVEAVACFRGARKVVEMEAEDTAVALLRFAGGAVAEMTGTFGLAAGPYAHGVAVYGHEGYVEFHSRLGVRAIAPRRFGDPHLHEVAPALGSGFEKLWQDYTTAIATGAPARVSAEDGRKAVEIILAAYRAADEGRTVSLPLTHAKLQREAAAAALLRDRHA